MEKQIRTKTVPISAGVSSGWAREGGQTQATQGGRERNTEREREREREKRRG